MQAILIFSLGDLLSARASPPATQKPTPAREVCFKKSRRLVLVFIRVPRMATERNGNDDRSRAAPELPRPATRLPRGILTSGAAEDKHLLRKIAPVVFA